MRLLIRTLAPVFLMLALASCSGKSPSPAAPAAKPIAAKSHARKQVELASAIMQPSPLVAEALARATKEHEHSDAPAKPAAIVKPAARARKLPHASTAHGALDTAKLGSRGLLHWLPPDASLVVRFPNVESLGEVRRRTTMGALLQNPAVMLALCAPDGPLGQLTAKVHAELPELEALLEKLPGLKGELVLGVAHIEPPADSKPGAAGKLTAALAFDAGTGADELQPLLEPLLARLQQQCAADCARPEGGWGLAGWSGEFCFEIRRFGNVFTALYGNDPEFAHAFQPEGESASFAAAPVVASAPDLNTERQGVLEFYLNADPAWTLVKAMAPVEAQAVIEKLGLFGVHGAAMSLGLDAKGLAEVHTWSAPAHKDILSRVLAGAPAERALARWIPADAVSAGLHVFDLSALYETIVGLLPEPQRAELQQTLAQCKKQTRIDLAADVIGNFGPSFAMVSRGDALGLSGGPAGMVLAIETHDDDKVGELIGKLAPLLPPALKRRTSEFAGHALLTYDLSSLGMAVSSLSLCRVDGALLLATDDKLLERCLLAGKEPGVKQAALAAALATDGVIGASLSAPVGELPATLSILRVGEAGLALSSRDGAGSIGSGFAAMLPVVAAIAIPKLMSARLHANETAALAQMRWIASAEALLVTSGSIDVDLDGSGEYGSLSELSGAAPLRGRGELLEPAIMADDREHVAGGVLTRSGYHFVAYLPAAKGGYCEPKAADGKDVSANDAEIRYIVWAWPASPGATGNRVFVLDQEGDLMCCENAGGRYSGVEHHPEFDAYLPQQKSVDRTDGKPYLGRDGLTWHMIPDPLR